MATRASLTGSGLNHPTYYWHDASTWVDGVVPNSGDTITIAGFRTTVTTAQGNTYIWTGTTTILVTSSTGFPNVGSFYTTTFFGRKIKVDYLGKVGNSFTGCTVDQSYQVFDSSTINGSYIPTSSYVHSPAPYIIIDSGVTASGGIMTITTGGWLQINSGGTYNNYEYVDLQDGNFIMKDSSTFNFMRHLQLNRFIISNYAMQKFLVQGDEIRTYAKSTTEINIGSTNIECDSTTNFEIGDKISIYNKDYHPFLKNYYNWCPPNTYPVTNDYVIEEIGVSGTTYDEGFDVVGKDLYSLFLKSRNGIEANVLDVVDEYTVYADEQRFKVGDKILLVNSGGEIDKLTIESVEDADYLLRDYKFASGATLSDWTTDTSSGFTNYANFSTDGTKLIHSTTTSNNIFIKDLWIKNVKVEAWMSPLNQITGGTLNSGYFGIKISSDPTADKYVIESTARETYMYVYDSTSRISLQYRQNNGISSDTNLIPTSYLPNPSPEPYSGYTLKNDCRTLTKYTIENRKGFTKVYINDDISGGFEPIIEKFNNYDSFYGRVGIFTNNSSFTCTRIKVYSTCQKIKFNSNFNIDPDGGTIYQSGTEYYHPSGCTVLKIGSIISNLAGHYNYAYAYQGATNGYFPYIKGVNSNDNTTISTSSNVILNQQLYPNFFDITSGADKYIVIDLLRQVDFTHISYVSYYDIGYANTYVVGVAISGSTDGTTWTGIYPKQSDPLLSCVASRLRYYNCGSLRSYRYIKFSLSQHSTSANNYIVNVGVHNFISGYTLTLNNTNDLNIGDRIMAGSKSTYQIEYSDANFYANIVAGIDRSGYTSSLKSYYTIIGKTGNTIALERPFVHGYLDVGDMVWKVNRNTKIQGFTTKTLFTRGNIYSLDGSSYPRSIKMLNVEVDQVGTDHVTMPGTSAPGLQYRGGLSFCSYDIRNPIILDGISFHDGYINTSGYFGSYYSSICYRNSYMSNFYYNYCYNVYGIKLFYNNIFVDVYYPVFNESGKQVNFMFNYVYNTGCVYSMNYNITAYSQLFYQNDMSLVTKNYAGSILQMIEFGSTLTASPYKSKYIILKDNYAECPSYIQSGYDEINEFDNILFNYKNSAYRSIANMFYYTNVFHNWFTHSWNIKDVNRWGYSMVSGYNVYYIKKYEEDFIRVYKYDSINYWPIMGMNLYLTKDITVTFNIEFLYRHTTDQIYQVDYPTSNYGALTFNVIKDGIILITAALPKSRNWRLFNYTYTINGIGNYFITFGQSTLNGRLDLKNISSRIYTDYPDSVEIMGNNLDDNKIMNNIDYFKQSSNKVPDVEKKIRLGVQNLMVNI